VTTLEEIKALAKLPEKAVPLCLRGDLQARYEELERELKVAEAASRRGGTLAGSAADVQPIKAKMDALREEMQQSTKVFILRALTKRRWSDLAAANPPRDEDKAAGLDYHGERFTIAAVQACLIDPALTVPEVEQLCDEVLTQGQWDTLFAETMWLNRRTVEVPT
jgi:hypothetical protein